MGARGLSISTLGLVVLASEYVGIASASDHLEPTGNEVSRMISSRERTSITKNPLFAFYGTENHSNVKYVQAPVKQSILGEKYGQGPSCGESNKDENLLDENRESLVEMLQETLRRVVNESDYSNKCASKLYALGQWVRDESLTRPYGSVRWNVTSDEGAPDGGNINAVGKGQYFGICDRRNDSSSNTVPQGLIKDSIQIDSDAVKKDLKRTLFPGLKVLNDDDQELLNIKTREKIAFLASSLAREEELAEKRRSRIMGYEREDMKYKWVPSYCTLKDFEPHGFCNALPSKGILFVGDSLTMQLFASLCSMLGPDICPGERINDSTLGLGICAKARFDGKPVIMRFVRNDFLRTYEMPGALEQLAKDQLRWDANGTKKKQRHWANETLLSQFGILVINSGAHISNGYPTAMSRAANFVGRVKSPDLKVYFRTTMLGHRNCMDYSRPLSHLPKCEGFFHQEFKWHKFPYMNSIAEKIWKTSANASIIDPLIPMAYRSSFVIRANTGQTSNGNEHYRAGDCESLIESFFSCQRYSISFCIV